MFNTEKYCAMAYAWPGRGEKLRAMVEKRWHEWVEKVEKATWCLTKDHAKIEEIAQYILTEAVWGFGVEDWYPKYTHGERYFGPVAAIFRLQDTLGTGCVRTDTLDQKFFLSTGLFIPAPFSDLDFWLDCMWNTV